MFEAINSFVTSVNNVVWGWAMIILLFGTHVFLTIRTGFIQRKTITKGIKLSISKDPDAEGEVSQFGALTTALAATIGTGNIIGVGTAIAMGGPGAVLWCWLTGVFGIATKYAESLIAVKYRVKTADGRMQGGAMYALERGLNMKWLGMLFAILAGFASFGIGCATQVNAIATACRENFGVPAWIVGVVVAILTAIVIFGGIKAIANVCEKLVPFMAIFYVLGCVIILCMNYDYIIPALATICKLAFTPGAAAGGLVGTGIRYAIQYGVARGLFSNEAGMGSTPHAHAVAKVDHPVEQGFVAMTGVFIDTFIVLNLTALVILTTKSIPTGKTGAELSQYAFSTLYGKGGDIFVAICMFFFAFSTIIGWYFFGQANIKYLFGPKAVKVYAVLAAVCVFLGSLAEVELVWTMQDTFNSLMVIPNILALFALTGVIKQVHEDYFKNFKPKKK